MPSETEASSSSPSSALYRELLDTAPDAIIVVDAEGRIELVNIRTEELFGYSRDALIGREVELLIPDRFRAPHKVHRAKFVSAPKVRPMGSGLALFGRKRDGSEFPIEISLSPLAAERGMLISASIRDISDRKQSELRVRRIQEHLLSAIESIQGAFAIFDAEDRAVLSNDMFQRLFASRSEHGFVGRSFEEIVRANADGGTFDLSETTAEAIVARWLRYHAAPEGSLDLTTRDRRKLRVVERRTTEGGTVTLISDITDDARREDELRRARSLAEAASSAKSEFLSSMSHELRTPLNAILGFAQLLQRDKKTPLSQRQLERVGHVLKGGEHLLRLIDEVLDLARVESGRVTVSLEPVSAPEIIAEVVSTLESIAQPSEIQVVPPEVPPGLPPVHADRMRLKQILMNFGSNAIKYGRRHGTMAFSIAGAGEHVRIMVTDDGIGIPTDKQDKIFQPFQRAGQETGPIEGTGIGLAITKRLAELMGGTVGFESREGCGSKFWIELQPHRTSGALAAHKQVRSLEPSKLASTDGPHYRVVYIEDNPSNIAFMADVLEDFERVELFTATSAELGLPIVRAERPQLVIMDINLPGMSGLDAMKQLREWPETRDIPVIGLSAAAMVQDGQRVRAAGFYRYLTKPVKVDELVRTLEELLLRS